MVFIYETKLDPSELWQRFGRGGRDRMMVAVGILFVICTACAERPGAANPNEMANTARTLTIPYALPIALGVAVVLAESLERFA